MEIPAVETWLREIAERVEWIRQAVADIPDPIPEPLPGTTVPVGGDLQAALTAGGAIRLAANAVFTNGYTCPKSVIVIGEGNNTIAALDRVAPALDFPLRFMDGVIDNVTLAVNKSEFAARIGRNDSTQVDVEASPKGVTFTAVKVESHRGKRPFEVHGRDVKFLNVTVTDSYDPEGSDSQAIWIGNCPGPVLIEGGHLEAAAENVMVGGDTMKIPNCRPTGITVRKVTLTKPLAWKGVVPTKNLLELKDGHDVLIEDCDLTHSWRSGQDGYAFVFTPTQGGSLRNVVVKNCRVSEVGGICNIGGVEQHGNYPDLPRTQLHVIGGTYKTNKAAMGGRGCFALIMHGPESVIIEDADITLDGTAFILVGDQKPIDQLHVLNSRWNYPQYGIMISGYSHGDNRLGVIKDLKVEGNTISGAASAFKTRFPNNTYV